jgi:hypothetical protein
MEGAHDDQHLSVNHGAPNVPAELSKPRPSRHSPSQLPAKSAYGQSDAPDGQNYEDLQIIMPNPSSSRRLGDLIPIVNLESNPTKYQSFATHYPTVSYILNSQLAICL